MSGYLKEGEMRKILNITMLLMLFVDVCFFILLHYRVGVPVLSIIIYGFMFVFSQIAIFTFLFDKLKEIVPDSFK